MSEGIGLDWGRSIDCIPRCCKNKTKNSVLRLLHLAHVDGQGTDRQFLFASHLQLEPLEELTSERAVGSPMDDRGSCSR